MKLIIKRFGAYLIDIILVSVVATLLTSNKYINMDYERYKKTYDEYNNVFDDYNDFYGKLEKSYEDKEISNKEYEKLLEYEYTEELEKIYDDKKIDEEEYEDLILNLNDNYINIDLNYSYKLLKYSIIPTVVNLMCILIYFVVIQFYFNGQTLGKKIMKLRIVSNNTKDLNVFNFFIRSLIVNEVFINIISVIMLMILSKNNYIAYNKIIYVITYILEMAILFTMVFDKNNRGLHDYVSNTRVIEDKKE